MKHIVMFSGGVGSWATAKRVAERHRPADVWLVFADTKMEDPDLYRFLGEAAVNVGGELVILVEGRDPWEVFFDVRFLGNTRVDPCSRILKRELIRKWVNENCDPDDTTIYLGIDWTEEHRFKRAGRYWEPYTVEAPLIDPPVDKAQQLEWLRSEGVEPPRLYGMGFPHNNCGGFCVKAGHAQFKLLLEKAPDRYAYHEAKEQEIREFLGKDVAILRDRRGGDIRPLTMKEFRERVLADKCETLDLFEWGGCACFTPDEYNETAQDRA